jgi:hypothetical protein
MCLGSEGKGINKIELCPQVNKTIVGLDILVLIVGVALWLYPVNPYHQFGFILFLAGIIVLIVGLAIPKKNALN